MYFMLGDIRLEAMNVTAFNESLSAEFAEHNVLKGKPRLQALGEKLIELHLAVRLHHSMGGVESRYQALIKAQAEQQALALIWGRGKYKGNYVITQINSNTLFTDAQGTVLCRELQINLKEFVGEIDSGFLGQAVSLGGKLLMGALMPHAAIGQMSEMKQIASKAVALFNEGKRVVNEVRNTVSLMRQDPTTTLAYLPHAISNLDGALSSFGELAGLSGALEGVRSVIPQIEIWRDEVGTICSCLQQMKQYFAEGKSDTSATDWITASDRALNQIDDSEGMLAPMATNMTAWIVLRADKTENEDDTTTA